VTRASSFQNESNARERHIASVDRARAMFGTLGSLFASGPRLKYDLGREFASSAFGVWTHRRGTCQVRRTRATRARARAMDGWMDGWMGPRE